MKRVLIDRAVDRLLTRYGTDGDLPYHAQGYLLIELHLLRQIIATLNAHEKDVLLEDLRELEDLKRNAEQKHRTVQRMYRTFSFLLPSGPY
jgi:hypothetical protein